MSEFSAFKCLYGIYSVAASYRFHSQKVLELQIEP
jgi:hypothetical protein